MADCIPPRRQPPSPLVFSPESVLSPPTANTKSNGSSSNTVSMPFVRRHVTRRLKAAKAECDKELQRVTNNITAFFEERLREVDLEAERDRERGRGRRRDSFVDSDRDVSVYQNPGEFGALPNHDGYHSDGGYEAEVEYGRHSRQRAYDLLDEPRSPLPTLTHWASSPRLNAASNGSQASPASLRRQNTAPWDRPLSSSVSSSVIASSPASSTILLPETSLVRRPTNPGSASGSWGAGVSSRRLSRTVHAPIRPQPPSGQSSRSTSRSRSPLPPLSTHASFSEFATSGPQPSNRRSSRILLDDPVDPIMTALYDLIAVATDVTDMSLAQLTAQPKVCESLVQRIQCIGKAWDDHPDWHGRNWYVQILLAVASLSRVVEWWEAEKQFWNFDDNGNEQDEPLMFVTKPADDPIPAGPGRVDPELENFRLNDDYEDRVHSAKPLSPPRKLKESAQKELPALPPHEDSEPPRDIKGTLEATRVSAESARVLATERLKLQAETAHNQNIVMELSLDGDHFIWINHAWRVVVGTDPEMLAGTRISSLLAPGDWNVFREVTQRLREDDSHTVEVRFRLKVEPNDQRESNGAVLFQQMEGKGMLMIDREDGQPSHTMWVVKPLAPPQYEHDTVEAEDMAPRPSRLAVPIGDRAQVEPTTPFEFTHPIMVNPILCRICEGQIPQWYFEKHSETCAETHRLEAEIIECNESIAELKSTIRDLSAAIDRSSSGTAPEYRGMPVFIPPPTPLVSSPLQLFRMNKMQRFGVKKIQKRLLEQLDDILQVALEVAIPSLKEEESKEPIERQRLLSPGSERKISQIRNWAKPNTEDAALSQLIQDSERVMRQKIDNAVRMQNTIRYAEKIWHEWEERVGQALASVDEDDSDESTSEEGTDEQAHDDILSAKSEFSRSRDTSSGPTPLASSSPAPTPTPSDVRVAPIPHPSAPIPIHGSVVRSALHTRSSTPSSISSPLALAAPIVAPSPDDVPPEISLDDAPQIKTRKSSSSLLEPKFIVTPPTSPLFAPRDGPFLTRETSITSKRGHRRQSTVNPGTSAPGSLSPKPSAGPLTRTTPTSIKDFEIIKPISKGAFGSVFLAKKKATGDYYAIKVLKKADMIAKNQITNVKAERMILMKQAESPFVAKLYFTFQSKENLYLVMEYLNGGDCAALIKSLGCLPEEWTKNYIAEVTLGLEYLHQRGVVHRDLKPDNLLIDQHGHLKLTDFGLSRIGLLGRQTRESQAGRPLTRYNSRSRPPSIDSAYIASPLMHDAQGSGYFNQRSISRVGYSPYQSTDDVESSGSESLSGLHSRKATGRTPGDSPLQSFATELTTDLRSHSNSNSACTATPPGEQKFVGTPDYLAPETILGLRGDDAAVDWWALGVITYEFLYGIPPFHADSPEKVFENILSGHIEWHEDWITFSDEAREFMQSLMTLDPAERLGANGAEEVKVHPFFHGIDWDKVTTTEAAFIPQVSDPESTDYFDPRGAIPQLFQEDEAIAITNLDSPIAGPSSLSSVVPVPVGTKEPASTSGDDFGSFSFKNLPVLKQANDDVIRKLKTDQMTPLAHTLTEPSHPHHQRKRSISTRLKKPPNVVTTPSEPKGVPTNPPSPATSASSVASSPSRASLPPSTPVTGNGHGRKPSEFGAVERFKLSQLEGGLDRRNTMPSRWRTASVSSGGDGSGSEIGHSSHGSGSQAEYSTPPSSVHSIDLRKGPDPSDRAVTCLLAEDNPITAKIIETLLIRLGCRCIVVADGSEAISVAMGDIKFDCILMDLQMPVLDGESAARYIKSTKSKNTNTPIIAVSAYSTPDPNDLNCVFSACLSKPLQKADLLAGMRQLGFKTSTIQSGPGASKVTAAHTT